jgi:hypothetical protein
MAFKYVYHSLFGWTAGIYINTLGNKRVELFDMGAEVSEPTVDDNVPSCETSLADSQISSNLFDITTWGKRPANVFPWWMCSLLVPMEIHPIW